MPRRARELRALEVKRMGTPGRHAVGGAPGLCLNITETGATSWILRSTVAGKRRPIGLGPYPEVSLAEARQKAQETRMRIASGIDPVEERIAARIIQVADGKFSMTFKDAFERYFREKLEGELRNAKHSKQ